MTERELMESAKKVGAIIEWEPDLDNWYGKYHRVIFTEKTSFPAFIALIEAPLKQRIAELELEREALQARMNACVPEGWQLMPKEPNQEMVKAASSMVGQFCNNTDWYNAIHKVVLAAAPKPAAPKLVEGKEELI